MFDKEKMKAAVKAASVLPTSDVQELVNRHMGEIATMVRAQADEVGCLHNFEYVHEMPKEALLMAKELIEGEELESFKSEYLLFLNMANATSNKLMSDLLGGVHMLSMVEAEEERGQDKMGSNLFANCMMFFDETFRNHTKYHGDLETEPGVELERLKTYHTSFDGCVEAAVKEAFGKDVKITDDDKDIMASIERDMTMLHSMLRIAYSSLRIICSNLLAQKLKDDLVKLKESSAA